MKDYLEEFPGKSDELRYVLASIMPEQKDSEFTWSDYRERVNNELADVLGNFINRVIVLTRKYYESAVPEIDRTKWTADEDAIVQALESAPGEVADLIRRNRFRDALQAAMGVARLGNKYMTEQEPWKIKKTDEARTAVILNTCIQVAANCSVLLEPSFHKPHKNAGCIWDFKCPMGASQRHHDASGRAIG